MPTPYPHPQINLLCPAVVTGDELPSLYHGQRRSGGPAAVCHEHLHCHLCYIALLSTQNMAFIVKEKYQCNYTWICRSWGHEHVICIPTEGKQSIIIWKTPMKLHEESSCPFPTSDFTLVMHTSTQNSYIRNLAKCIEQTWFKHILLYIDLLYSFWMYHMNLHFSFVYLSCSIS